MNNNNVTIKLIKEAEENFFIPTKKFSTSFNHTIIINEAGDLYGWGNADYDQLGLGVELVKYIIDPTLFKFFRERQLKVIDVSMGEKHVMAIVKKKDGSTTDSGELYSWGLDLYGRLGYRTELVNNNDEELAENNKFVFKRVPYRLKLPEQISRVACGKDFSACLTTNGKLYTWGNNTWGNLGLNLGILSEEDLDGVYIVPQPTLVTYLEHETIIQVVCGSKHMMALTKNRRIYSWGEGVNGALGHGTFDSIQHPIIVKELSFEDIIFICAGENSSAAINSKGQLYTWGNGKYGKLGLGTIDNVKTPRKVTDSGIINDRVFYVGMGMYHSVCSTLEGRTFAMGYSYKGRLGCISEEECNLKVICALPKQIKDLEGIQITQLNVGSFHTLAVSSKGKLFGWGENKNFVFGKINVDDFYRNKSQILYNPIELPVNKSFIRIASDTDDLFKTYFLSSSNLQQNFKISKKLKILKIACGSSHTLALTGSGDVLSWGYGTAGQLGQGAIDALPNPTLVDFKTDAKMLKIYAGRNHSMTITTITNQVYTWGEGLNGQLGYKKNNAFEPQIVEFLVGKSVLKGCLGSDNSAAITDKGDLYVWGSNTNNKLGLNSNNRMEIFPVLNKNLRNLKSISFGLEHSCAMLQNGEVYVWGNNLFGQLGLGHYFSVDSPTKINTTVPFLQIKCGSYHTLFLDINNFVYICGKAKLNLAAEDEKNKPNLEQIEDFKGDKKVRKIQVGYGNSLVLTFQNEVFGFGKNDYSKAGGDLSDEFVTKNPRLMTFEINNNKKRISINKIFASYDHCFALSSLGDIFAWGNPRLFRLTGGFGDEISRLPKIIDIEWLHKGIRQDGMDDSEDEDKENAIDTNLDERQILTIMNKNMRILTFREIHNFMKKMGKKYDEEELIRKDEVVLKEIQVLLKELSSQFNKDHDKIKHLYMEIDQLTGIRIKEINPPRSEGMLMKTNIAKDLLSYTDEIEKIYSFLFVHPCIMQTLLEHTKPEEYEIFMKGITPIYRGLDIKSKQSENYLALNFISFFRISLELDYLPFKNDLDNFCTFGQRTLIEIQLKTFLFNYYNRSYLIDILSQSFHGLKQYVSSAKETNNPLILDKILKFVKNTYEAPFNLDIKYLAEIKQLVILVLTDLENNYHKFSDTFIYCFSYFKNSIKKDQLSSIKDRKALRIKLASCMLRFFFSNIVGKSLKELFHDGYNDKFICQTLDIDIDSTNKKLFEIYLTIIGELFERIACGEPYEIKEFKKKEEDNNKKKKENQDNIVEEYSNIKQIITFVNNMIEEMNTKLLINYIEKFPKSKYNFKKNIISSLVYYNLSMNSHSFIIEIDSLVLFLKFLEERKSIVSGDMNYQIFEVIENLNKVSNVNNNIINSLTSKKPKTRTKMKLTLDVKYLTNPIEFSNKYVKELKTSFKAIQAALANHTFEKCIKCNVILPWVFLKDGTEIILKQFKAKVKKQEFLYYSRIFLSPNFKPKLIKTLRDVIKSVLDVKKNLEDTFCTDVKEYQFIDNLQEFIRDINNRHGKSDDEKMGLFVNELHNHLRRKIHHLQKFTENQKIVQDINDASYQYREYLHDLTNSMDDCKGSLKLFTNSLNIEEDKDKLEAQLKHKILNKTVYTNDNSFRYKPLTFNISYLKNNLILFTLEDVNLKDKDVYIQITANADKKYFDLKLRLKRNNDIIKSAYLHFEEYFHIFINSSLYKNIYFQDYGKFNFNNLRSLIQTALSSS